MIYLISHGSYSDYRIYAVVEGEGDLIALYRQFREIYTPETIPLIEKGDVWMSGFYELIDAGERRLLESGLTEATIYTLEDAFAEWLIKEHGFKLIETEELNIDWRELPND